MAPAKTERKPAHRPESTPLALAKLLAVFVLVALAAEGIDLAVDAWLTDRAPAGAGKFLVPFQSGFLADPLIYVTLDASSVGTRIVSRAMFVVVIGFFGLLLLGQFLGERRIARVQLVGLAVIGVLALGVGPYLSLFFPLELSVVEAKSKRVVIQERESFMYAAVKPTARVRSTLNFAELRGFTVRYVSSHEDGSGRSFVELYAVKEPRRSAGAKIAGARFQPVLVGRRQVRGGLLDLPKYLRDEEQDKQQAMQSGRQAAAFLTEVVLRATR
jgi:hypothetical protein